MYATKDLHADIKRRSFDGFKLHKDIMSYDWTQQYNNSTRRIGLSYRKYASGFLLSPPNVSIIFDEVEKRIENTLIKYGIDIPCTYTIRGYIHPVHGVDYTLFDCFISDSQHFSGQEAFDYVFDEIDHIIINGALPFFENYTTIEKVADLLSNKSPQEVVPYIQGAILFPKTILILKLANHEKFKQKLIEFREDLLTCTLQLDVYKRMLTVYDDLFAEDLKNLGIS